MKLKRILLIPALVILLSAPQAASANMAAPKQADVGSAIAFEKHDAIAVTSEVLDIKVHGTTASIMALYTMKNTTNETVTTPAMFLSPNIENSGMSVTVNGKAVPYEAQSYGIYYSPDLVGTSGWQYTVLSEPQEAPDEGRSIDAISFDLTFGPLEECRVSVSYTYALGGYPDYDFNAKRGEIEYLLTPAAMWKDFENLKIYLTLDEDMPKLVYSNLEFEKTGKRTYEYVSDTLPEDDLVIRIDENAFQNMFSTLRSPYLGMGLMVLSPFIVIGIIVIVAVIRAIVRARRRRQEGRTS